MFAKLRTLALALSLPLAACAQVGPTGTSAGAIHSCFQTASGLECVETPDGAATGGQDVDGDGVIDPFVCADDDQDGDGTPDFQDSDDDDDGTPDQGSGDAPGTPGSDDNPTPGDDDGTPDQGGGNDDDTGTPGADDSDGGLDDDGGVSGDSDDNGVDDSIQCDDSMSA